MTSLQKKTLAINLLNKYGAEILKYEIQHFEKFEGIDIFKNDMTIKKKYEHDQYPEIKGKTPEGYFYQVSYYLSNQNGSFGSLRIKICLNGGSQEERNSFAIYEDLTLYPYNIKENKINIDRNAYGLNEGDLPQYNAEEMQEQAKKVEELAKQYEKAVSNVPYLFRNILNVQRLTNY
jgi:hypothetical protein